MYSGGRYFVTMAVPPIVLVWYAYTSDFQAQGRVCDACGGPCHVFRDAMEMTQLVLESIKFKRPADGFPARLYVLYHQRGLYLCSGLLAILQITKNAAGFS